MRISDQSRLILLWLLIGALAVLACTVSLSAAHVGGEYVPVYNDSYYHARRIVDTAADPSAFYQFDPKIHAPDGALLTWPWGYDYTLGWMTRIAVETGLVSTPMQFVVWVPAFAVLISVALMMLIARRLTLSIWSAALAGLCVALSPLTQTLHGVGIIDHHWAEYIFVLLTLALGLKWFKAPENPRAAVSLGVTLGLALGVHNGLFILQVPIVIAVFLHWLQGIRLPRKSALYFGGALLVTTMLILLPSLPFRLGRFEYYTLSWFHLYAAGGTALVIALLSLLPFTKRNLLLLAGAVVVYLLPLGHQVLMAHSFLSGTFKRLALIGEVQSPRQLARPAGGLLYVSGLYSLFLWLAPFALAISAYRAWVERQSWRLFFWIAAVCGLCLLAMQYRLHYFGSFALFLPWLVLAESMVSKWEMRRKLIMLVTSLAFLLMYALPLRYSLPSPPQAGGEPDFPVLRIVLADLRKACEKEPGIVLTDPDAGHYVRYYTDCSVISNNFLLTKEDAAKVELVEHLFSLPADKVPKEAPYVRYVLVRPVRIQQTERGPQYIAYTQGESAALLGDLLLRPLPDVSSHYELLRSAFITDPDPTKKLPYMRLFKVRGQGEHAALAADNSRH